MYRCEDEEETGQESFLIEKARVKEATEILREHSDQLTSNVKI